MIERDTEAHGSDDEGRHETGNEGEAARPAQSSALHKAGGGEDAPQDETDDTRWDTDEHSDAPGATGTG